MSNREKFIEIFRSTITREGADKLLEYLTEKTDFFTAPASTRFHGVYEGGLLEHSLNVYECLCDFVKRPRFREKYGFVFDEESIAIAALLHDICKTNFYKTEMRNVKKNGVWESVPYYTIRSWRKIGIYPFGIYKTYKRRGVCNSLSHGLFGPRGCKPDRKSARNVSSCFCSVCS